MTSGHDHSRLLLTCRLLVLDLLLQHLLLLCVRLSWQLGMLQLLDLLLPLLLLLLLLFRFTGLIVDFIGSCSSLDVQFGWYQLLLVGLLEDMLYVLHLLVLGVSREGRGSG